MRNFFEFGFIILIITCISCNAQNYPVYNSFYINPYLYNPAEAASDFSYLFLNHRQQWMNIEGSPELTTVNFNSMINNSRSGVGAKISSYKRGLLSTTDIAFTYAYGIALSEKSKLFFALSGGTITNNIDISQADPADPAITHYMANNFQPAGNFGMLFKSESGINFGIALPQLFIPKFNSTSSFENTSVSPLDNLMVSAYYKKKVDGKIISRKRKGIRKSMKTGENFAPLEFYALYKYAKAGNSQAEAMIKLNLSEKLWLGAAYRHPYGMSGSLGLTISKFLFSYSYEPGNQPEPAFSLGTHEIQLGLRLGELKKFRKKAPLLRSTLRPQMEQHAARFSQNLPGLNEPVEEKPKEKKKFYVFIRVFGDFTSADRFKKEMRSQKFNANVLYNKKDRKYYVHIFETEKSTEAYEEVRNLKNFTKLKSAKVLTTEIE